MVAAKRDGQSRGDDEGAYYGHDTVVGVGSIAGEPIRR